MLFNVSNEQATKGRWFGNDCHKTTFTAFSYEPLHHTNDEEAERSFTDLCARLNELTLERDGNGCPKVELGFYRRCERVVVIAFRFTSDWAYHQHRDELVSLGSRLARGTFEPFNSGSNDFNMYLR